MLKKFIDWIIQWFELFPFMSTSREEVEPEREEWKYEGYVGRDRAQQERDTARRQIADALIYETHRVNEELNRQIEEDRGRHIIESKQKNKDFLRTLYDEISSNPDSYSKEQMDSFTNSMNLMANNLGISKDEVFSETLPEADSQKVLVPEVVDSARITYEAEVVKEGRKITRHHEYCPLAGWSEVLTAHDIDDIAEDVTPKPNLTLVKG